MNHISTRLIAFFCAAGVSVCATGATPPMDDSAKAKKPPSFGQLAPADVQAIQGLGLAVLAARAAPDPSQEALRSEMKALGTSLDQNLTAVLLTPPVLKIGKGRTLTVVPNETQTLQLTAPQQYKFVTGTDGKVTLEAPATPVIPPVVAAAAPKSNKASQALSQRQDRFVSVRNRLSIARQRADQLATAPQARAASQNARTNELLSKSKAIHNELLLAMDDTSADSTAKLINLRDRLRPKTLAQVLAERKEAARLAGEPIAEPTPTISFRTHHR